MQPTTEHQAIPAYTVHATGTGWSRLIADALVCIPVSVGTILLILAAVVEMMTAGRVSSWLGNGRLWRRVRHGRTTQGD